MLNASKVEALNKCHSFDIYSVFLLLFFSTTRLVEKKLQFPFMALLISGMINYTKQLNLADSFSNVHLCPLMLAPGKILVEERESTYIFDIR